MRNTRSRHWLAGPLLTVITVGATGVLHAQPDTNDVGKAENPIPPEPGAGQGNITPEQRQQARQQARAQMQQRREANMRATLKNAGFTDIVVQDAVVAFVIAQNSEERDKMRNSMRDKMRQLNQAVNDNSEDQQIAALLADIQADTQSVKAEREAALKNLDAKISYSTKPRLEAVLMLSGVLGENAGGRSPFGAGTIVGGVFVG